MKGQSSADYVASAFIFSLVILFTFVHITSTYYSRSWEMTRADARMDTERFAYFLTKSSGNWSSNPVNSTLIGFGGTEINETLLQYFVGMQYPTIQNKTRMKKNFKVETRILPSIGIISDISEFYCNNTDVEIRIDTTVNSTLSIVIIGGNYPNRTISYSTTTGKFHKIMETLSVGSFNLKALAYAGNNYGSYEVAFMVINC